MDIRRITLLTVFLISSFMLWDAWLRFTGQTSLLDTQTQSSSNQVKQSSVEQIKTDGLPQVSQNLASSQTVLASTAAAPKDLPTEKITIQTSKVRAIIDTHGGQIIGLELLKYRDHDHAEKPVHLFDQSADRTYLAQTGLLAKESGLALPNHQTIFTPLPVLKEEGGAVQKLSMVAEQAGVRLTRTYIFRDDSYQIDLQHKIENNSGASLKPLFYAQLLRDDRKPSGESMFYSTFTGPAVYTDSEKFKKVKFDHIAENTQDYPRQAKANETGWIAMIQHYFVSTFIIPKQYEKEFFTRKLDSNLFVVGSIFPLGIIENQQIKTLNLPLYAGPQASAVLEKIAPGLDLVKDYGWLTVVAKPIFWLMQYLHSVIHNWGWTIVALTVLIKLLFFPLSAASYRSMARMKEVMPKMQALREQYKSEPARMNQEMVKFYQTEKINPFGGCFPILVQIPVFIALYWVLLASVEMRDAPWLGWITDLTSPDPYYILPLLMAVSMFIQTKLNPKPPDPLQAKMMAVLPVVFSVMFFFFPAGLVLYWVVNNILSIAQQWFITQRVAKSKTV